MLTGEGDIGGLGRIQTWHSSGHTDAFEGECGKVRDINRVYRNIVIFIIRLEAQQTAYFPQGSPISRTPSNFTRLTSAGL